MGQIVLSIAFVQTEENVILKPESAHVLLDGLGKDANFVSLILGKIFFNFTFSLPFWSFWCWLQ